MARTDLSGFIGKELFFDIMSGSENCKGTGIITEVDGSDIKVQIYSTGKKKLKTPKNYDLTLYNKKADPFLRKIENGKRKVYTGPNKTYSL